MWQGSIGTPYMACFYNGCVVFMNKEFDIIEEELNKLSFFTNVGKDLVYGRDRMDIFLEKAGHPEKAYRNAKKYFPLNQIEVDIIRTHMWPVTFRTFPRTREGWVTTLTDKYCSLLETGRRK